MEEISLVIVKIDVLRKEIENFEANPDDYIDMYEEMLDEIHGTFMGYVASYILKQVDPTAYRCGLLDYVDSLGVTPPDEWDTELSDLFEELEDLIDDRVEELDALIEGLEQDLKDLKDEDEDEADIVEQEIENAKQGLKELQKIREEYL